MDYLIDFSEQELGTVVAALVELPYKTVAPLLNKIDRRIVEQQQAMQAAQAPAQTPAEEAPAEEAPAEEAPAEQQEEPAPAE